MMRSTSRLNCVAHSTRFNPFTANKLLYPVTLLGLLIASVAAAQIPDNEQELLRQREREQVLQQQMQARPSVNLESPVPSAARLPPNETPCVIIKALALEGEQHQHFQWALAAADTPGDPALGQCLGAHGIAVVAQRIGEAIMQRGYITTRILFAPQSIHTGTLTMTVIPGHIRHIRFSDDSDPRASWRNAMPAKPGDLLNLRDLEQALENFKRVPSAEADLTITPTDPAIARPGDSDVVIQWKQALPFRLSLSLDDAGRRATGKYQTATTLSYDNWWTLNDLFYVSILQDAGGGDPGKRGTRGHVVYYSIPWHSWLIEATSSANNYHQSFGAFGKTNLTYSGNSAQNDLRLTKLVHRDSVRRTNLSLRGWNRESRNFVEDTEISNQHRRTSGWDIALTHREMIGSALLDANITYRRGTGAFNARRAVEETIGEGTSHMKILSADMLLTLPFTLASQRLRYSAAWRAQWNYTPLTPSDRFAIGSRHSVRGFDGELLLTGDRGWLIRQDIAITVPFVGQEIYTGADIGIVSGPAAARGLGNHLAGAVIGLRGGLGTIRWDLFAGRPLAKPQGFRSSSTVTGFILHATF